MDARVVNATQQPALEGKRLLGGYFVVDAIISRAITRNVELYAAAENIFDTVITTGRTTDGVISIGQPFMFRGGVRLRF